MPDTWLTPDGELISEHHYEVRGCGAAPRPSDRTARHSISYDIIVLCGVLDIIVCVNGTIMTQ